MHSLAALIIPLSVTQITTLCDIFYVNAMPTWLRKLKLCLMM